MKKFLALILCMLIITSLMCSCGQQEENASPEPSKSEESDMDMSKENIVSEESEYVPEEISQSVSEEASEPETERTWPYATATFIQPYAFASYNDKKWEKHCDYLLEAGIDTIILQWSVTDTATSITNAYYPTKLSDKTYTSVLLERLLSNCQKKGMKVIIGLNSPDEWFSITLTDKDWIEAEGKFMIEIAKEIYDLYYDTYSDTITGWYFAPEYYGGIGNVENGARFLSIVLDGLTDINPSIPMWMSPFLRSSSTPEETRDEWIEIFKRTSFREGDVFVCQDSVGAGGIAMYQLDSYFAALKEACDTVPGLRMWANNEDFTSTGKCASLDRFVSQLEITDKYVEGHITFAYSHYLAPDIAGNTENHSQYVEYYNTGVYEIPEAEDDFSYTGSKTLVSQGKSYTGVVNTRNDGFDDNGKKLTDGVIPSADGNNSKYFGSGNKGTMSVVVDLGEIYDNLAEFDVMNSFGNWGITSVDSVTYYVSDDGKEWNQVGSTINSSNLSPVDEKSPWILFDFKRAPINKVSGRYVKVDIVSSGWMWISEICVYTYDD